MDAFEYIGIVFPSFDIPPGFRLIARSHFVTADDDVSCFKQPVPHPSILPSNCCTASYSVSCIAYIYGHRLSLVNHGRGISPLGTRMRSTSLTLQHITKVKWIPCAISVLSHHQGSLIKRVCLSGGIHHVREVQASHLAPVDQVIQSGYNIYIYIYKQ